MATAVTDEFKISGDAQQQLAALLKSEDNDEIRGVRIYVAGSGCSGIQWGMTFADAVEESDAVMEADDLNIYVDPQCLATLDGVEIDYVNGPQGPSFVFNNTKAPAGGGCGTCGSSGGGCS
jgi:iron-sulfur cluster insertion protein